MTTGTRCPELEREFVAAGCGHSVAVHAASNSEAIDGHGLSNLGFPIGANPTRQKEFIAGRMLAQRCLVGIGQLSTPIGRGADREPLWPDGVVGSIAHTGTFAVAVAWMPSMEQQMVGIGIDVENCGRLDPVIWPTVFTPQEIARLEQESPVNRDLMATCMFSAKESVYKAQFPLTHRFIEFDEVALWMQSPSKGDSRKGWLRLEHDIRELAPFHFSIFYYCLGSIVITGAVALAKPT
jgi:4'-phosphopantetheinyl transferase EntD